MTLTIGKKIGIGFFIALVALTAIGGAIWRNLRELDNSSFWVSHTIEVKARLTALESNLLQAESAARGYQLIPSEEARRLMEQAAESAVANLTAIKGLTADNPAQVSNGAVLESQMNGRIAASRALIAARDQRGAAVSVDARQQHLVEDGARQMALVHQRLDEMTGEEDRLLAIRQHTQAQTSDFTRQVTIYGTFGSIVLVIVVGAVVTRSITGPLRTLGEGASRIGGGDYNHRVQVKTRDEVGMLAGIFNRMAEQIGERQLSLTQQDWLKGSLAQASASFQGQSDQSFVCQSVLNELAHLLDARYSAIYTPETSGPNSALVLVANYAAGDASARLAPGEGLVGQCFRDQQRLTLTEVQPDRFRIRSALSESQPATVVVLPAVFEGRVMAVLELASYRTLTPIQLDLLDRLAFSLGTVLNTIAARRRTENLLQESQRLAENLRSSEVQLQEQQEELKQSNEELEQANEEMRQTNEEMEEKVHLLAEQKRELENANREIEAARVEVEAQARQVSRASSYKSDFLASMSHELRTPLNSMLILSKMLAENGEANLSGKQIKYAETIYSSGNDLLELINEILDLAKIESGAVQVETHDVPFERLRSFIHGSFQPVAETKKLELGLDFSSALPAVIRTDERRLQQVLKNLLSNAFKFTAQGSVTLKVEPVTRGWDPASSELNRAPQVIAFSVTDTGIGIPPEKQQLIFEAFQQADAGTARKYGGTGLGLSISREIALLLHGSIQVSSSPGEGSTFTIFLPAVLTAQAPVRQQRRMIGQPGAISAAETAATATAGPAEPDADGLPDDRGNLQPGDLVLLVVDDDDRFAQILMEFARARHFKVVTTRTAARALALARQLRPSAITLDLELPDSDGWVVLDRLKHDPITRHIPTHIISVEEAGERSLSQGAVSYLQKPVTKASIERALTSTIEFLNRPLRNLLVVEDDPVQREALTALVGGIDVQTTSAANAAETFAALEKMRYDCVVIDLGLPDMAGLQLIREIQRRYAPHSPPIIVYTGKELSREEETELRMVSDSIVVKSARSPERLLDETALFLHRVQTKLPDSARRLLEQSQKNDSVLAGRKVLVVDDDVRNIFAITSALEAVRMVVRYAESGQGSIDLLKQEPDIEVVLMDVMMPEMDGFETTRRIRQMDGMKKLPIISVTAKAMKGDREKCLEAGASDYITKPVDMDQLRSLLRVWLYR